MSDLISRQAAIDIANVTDYEGLSVEDVTKVTDEVVKGLLSLPSAEPEERTAKVERLDMSTDHNVVYRCCNCGQYMHRTAWSNPVKYCPHCGCRLEWE